MRVFLCKISFVNIVRQHIFATGFYKMLVKHLHRDARMLAVQLLRKRVQMLFLSQCGLSPHACRMPARLHARPARPLLEDNTGGRGQSPRAPAQTKGQTRCTLLTGMHDLASTDSQLRRGRRTKVEAVLFLLGRSPCYFHAPGIRA